MVTTLEDTKRLAIGERLADLEAFQNLIISNDQKLISCRAFKLYIQGGRDAHPTRL